jgi:acetyltransferase-like isoleucine patch superfamily enzyme
MLHWLQVIRYPFLNGIYMPFKIYHSCGIKMKAGAKIELGGRVTFGTPDKNKAIVSRLPINFFIGKQATVKIGHSVSIGPGVNIIVKDNAVLRIGDSTYFTSDLHMEAVNTIEIGSNCAISWGTTIIDDHHHQLLPPSVPNVNSKKITIGDHVWVGCNVTILEGTQVGNNSVIAAGSLVRGVFPDNVLIAGNPARVVKQAINWE